MRKILWLSLFVIAIGILLLVFFGQNILHKNSAFMVTPVSEKEPDRTGEIITYDVQLGNLRLGNAIFKHLPKAQLQGRPVNLMTFETKLARFTDTERIYSDINSFLPLRVERQVSTWPRAETIIEDYDQDRFILTIKKSKGGKEDVSVIRKDNSINNAILLPYYVRNINKLAIGYSLMAKLPNQDFLVELVAKEEVNVPAGKFTAYRFESKPRKIAIWISADEQRIPLKIKGTMGLGYALIMRKRSLK